jgi:serine/threonine-protein kinase
VGVLYYVLVTGRRPFEGTNLAVLMAHANEPPPDPRTIGPGIAAETVAIVQRLMAKRPDDRYASPEELLLALEVHRAWLAEARPRARRRPARRPPSAEGTGGGPGEGRSS